MPFLETTMKSKIDYKEISKLVEFLEEKDLSDFELEVEGLKIKISRASSGTAPPIIAASSTAPMEGELETSSKPETSKPAKGENNIHYILSPMVGTFYRSPDPASPAFVEKGDKIEKNQTLCIIEAMKLMNEIESDINGTITDVFVQNGKPIEYGQKLFAIKPD